MKNPLVCLALLALALLSGCATNPVTGRSQLMLVSEKSAISQSAQAYSQMIGSFNKNGKVDTDTALKARVDGITGRLIAQAVRYRPETRSWDWSVKVIDEPDTINAFCMPGGKMALYTGLVGKLSPSDDELAQVMGHEIGHAIASHGAEKMSVALASDFAVTVLAAAMSSERNRQIAAQAGPLAALVAVKLPNSRQAESEADRIGIELAARAGYDPDAAATLWEKMVKATGNGGKFDLLSTHPAPSNRIEELRAFAPAMRPFYTADGPRPVFAFAGSSAPAEPPQVGAPVAVASASALVSSADQAPLTLYSAQSDRFTKGEVVLDCDSTCLLAYMLAKGEIKRLFEAGDWRRLAMKVVATNLLSDVSYVMLAVAAEKLTYVDSARTNYRRAMEARTQERLRCEGRFVDLCEGIATASLAEDGLARLADQTGALNEAPAQ
jgi:Zn-dependent protease with chaperone function